MQILDFVKSQNWEHKITAKEIKIKICPVCKAEEKDNQYKFSINSETGLYRCWRGSCAAKGHINSFSKDRKITISHSKNEFLEEIKKLKTCILTEKTLDWAKSRGISRETLEKTKCLSEQNTDNLIIPVYKNGQLINYKKRIIKQGTLKSITGLGQNSLIGMDYCTDETMPLIIIEGEIDWLSVLETNTEINVVSVPSGTLEMAWIEHDSEFLNRFENIIIWADNDVAGKKMLADLKNKLIDKNLSYIFSDEKDANEVLVTTGKEKILEYLKNSKEIKTEGIEDLAEIERKDSRDKDSVSTNFKDLDEVLDGFRAGEVTVWAGKNGSGKSTILSQSILGAVTEGKKVFFYSGELTKANVQEWFYLQINGQENLEVVTRKYSKLTEKRVTEENYKLISEWVKGKIYIYSKDDVAKEEELFKLMRLAYKKFGCRIFVIDNLLTVEFQKGYDFYREQSTFINKLKSFAKNLDTHCHIVCHSRKTTDEKIKKEDISGTADLSNLVDNVIACNRIYSDTEDCDMILAVLKNRAFGENKEIKMNFDKWTKRFYNQKEGEEKNVVYPFKNIDVDDELDFPFK